MDKQTEEHLERINLAEKEVHSLAKDGYISFADYSSIRKGFEEKTSDLTSIKPVPLKSLQVPVTQLEKSINHDAIDKNNKVQTPPQKPERSAKELRERRLTFILTSGVALLLLGGLLLALTNWLLLADGAKVVLISGIALLFAGMSVIAHKLNIPQTTLAFLMLFAFFVPIVFFSISYYGVFGSYLSTKGEGSALIASFAAFACGALYVWLFHLNAHRAFQYTTVIAFAISILFAAAFITTTAAMYVLILIAVSTLQLVIKTKKQSLAVFSEYKRFFPHFMLCQLLLISFIQLVFLSWNSLAFINIALVGLLLFWLARSYKPFFSFSILAILFFMIGMTNAIISSSVHSQLIPLLVLILPTALFLGYEFERRSKNEALLKIPLLVFFLLSIALTHLFSQIMFSLNTAEHWLYLCTLGWLCTLFIGISRLMRHQTLHFFSFLLSLYTITFIIGELSSTITISATLQTIVLLSLYVLTIRLKMIDVQLMIRPLKLGIVLMLSFVALQLWSAFEWQLLTGWLIVLSLFSIIVSRFDLDYRKTAGILSSVLLFLFTWSAFPALWSSSLYAGSVVIVTHFLVSTTIMVLGAFIYKRMFDLLVSQITFLLGGVSYGLTLLLATSSYEFFSSEAPQWLTLYAVAGAVYFYIAIHYFLNQIHLWWGTAIFSSIAYLSLLLYRFSDPEFVFWFILLLASGLFTSAGRMFMKVEPYGGFSFYTIGQGMLLLFSTLFIMYANLSLVPIHMLLLPIGFLIFEATLQNKLNWRIAQATLLSLLLLVYNWIWFNQTSLLINVDSLLLTGSILALLSVWKPFSFKKYGLFVAVAVLNAYLVCLPLFELGNYGLERMTLVLLIAGGTVVALEKTWRRGHLIAVPILLSGIALLFSSLSPFLIASLLMLMAFASLAAGVYFRSWSLLHNNNINSGQLASFVLTISSASTLFLNPNNDLSTSTELIVTLFFFSYLNLVFIKETNVPIRYGKAIAVLIGFFYPYSLLLSLLTISSNWSVYAYSVAFMILASILLRKVSKIALWRAYAETSVAIIGFGVMSFYTLAEQNLTNSLVLSILSVVALLIGFFLKYAAYFLTGIIVLLSNTMYTTRDAWGSLPWWVYLMTAGAALISFATYQEWKKRDDTPSLREQWHVFSDKLKRYFSRWT